MNKCLHVVYLVFYLPLQLFKRIITHGRIYQNYHEGFDHLCACLIVVQFVLYRSKLSRLVAHFLNYEMKSMLKAQYSARIVYDNVGIRYLTILWAAKRIFE